MPRLRRLRLLPEPERPGQRDGATRSIPLAMQHRWVDNQGVICKKWMAFLIGCCVLLGPVLSSAALLVPYTPLHPQEHVADCPHTQGHERHSAHTSSAYTASGQANHACCFSWVGMVSTPVLLEPSVHSGEPIPFHPSLRLTSRAEGLYRPPQQLS